MFDRSLYFASDLLFERLHLLFEYVCVAIGAFSLSSCGGCFLLLSGCLLLLGAFASRTVVVTGSLGTAIRWLLLLIVLVLAIWALFTGAALTGAVLSRAILVLLLAGLAVAVGLGLSALLLALDLLLGRQVLLVIAILVWVV